MIYPQQTTRRVLLTSIFVPKSMSEKQHNTSNKKRGDCLTWDETFMLMSAVIAQRSKDPNTQLGACIVDDSNIIIGLGYNGFPRGCSDDILPWGREGGFIEKKYAYVVHAERNAIYNANKGVKGCKLYCFLFPCNECVKTIIQSGIKEIIYAEDWYHDDEQYIASRKMLGLAFVKCRQYTPRYDIKKLFAEEKISSLPKENLFNQNPNVSDFIFEEII